MKVVIDTNVIISGLFFGGNPGIILEAAIDGQVNAYSSEKLIIELSRILKDKFKIKKQEIDRLEKLFRAVIVILNPIVVPNVLSDKPDNEVLAITHEEKIDFIVTGDKEILCLEKYNGAKIVSPNVFVEKNI